MIEWVVDTRDPNPCFNLDENWKLGYDVCMKMELPPAYVGIFKPSSSGLRFSIGKLDSSEKPTAYVATCYGDSGSGQWVTVNDEMPSTSTSTDSGNERRALVALAIAGVNERFNGPYGEELEGVCGGNLPYLGEKIVHGSLSVVITHPKILGFLKRSAQICGASYECVIL